MDILKALDVQTPLTGAVLAELLEQTRVAREPAHHVQGHILLSRREAGGVPITFSAAGVAIVVGAEPDDARSPHLGFGAGSFGHDPGQGEAVLSSRLGLDGVREFGEALISSFRLELGHWGAPPTVWTTR